MCRIITTLPVQSGVNVRVTINGSPRTFRSILIAGVPVHVGCAHVQVHSQRLQLGNAREETNGQILRSQLVVAEVPGPSDATTGVEVDKEQGLFHQVHKDCS